MSFIAWQIFKSHPYKKYSFTQVVCFIKLMSRGIDEWERGGKNPSELLQQRREITQTDIELASQSSEFILTSFISFIFNSSKHASSPWSLRHIPLLGKERWMNPSKRVAFPTFFFIVHFKKPFLLYCFVPVFLNILIRMCRIKSCCPATRGGEIILL